MASFSQMQSQMQSQGLAPPPEPLVGPSGPRVSTKGSCVDPSGNDPETGDSDRCGFYRETYPACLVAMRRVYEGSTIVHNTPLLPGQVKVSVEEVTDADARVPVPTNEVSLVGQTLHTFLAWPTHLVKSLSHQVAVSPAKPPPKPNPEVDDPLYLMTLTIPELFLRPYQLWILHLTETCMRAGNSDIYEFLEPQSIQRYGQSQFESESYIKTWMQSSKRDVYLGAYLNGALRGLDDAPQPKSKALARWIVVKCNRQKGSTECGYYVMHWMSTIILGTFRNNWEAWMVVRMVAKGDGGSRGDKGCDLRWSQMENIVKEPCVNLEDDFYVNLSDMETFIHSDSDSDSESESESDSDSDSESESKVDNDNNDDKAGEAENVDDFQFELTNLEVGRSETKRHNDPFPFWS
ncbi:hypothetical protein HKD37_19G052916 [Glycine soja]